MANSIGDDSSFISEKSDNNIFIPNDKAAGANSHVK